MEDFKKKRFSFGYEDTDKSIEIDLYGIVFEIKNIESVEKLQSLDVDDSNVIEKQLEKILGEGAIEKINKKRVSDGYCELNLDIELGILGCIFEAYAKGSANKVLERTVGAVKGIEKDVNSFRDINREQRRNYNRNNRGYNNRYRRY